MSQDLPSLIASLRDAVEAGEGHVPAADLEGALRLLAKAGARGALADATVVALAGATGSGKSTLFNALAGAELSETGVRRPTTGSAHAIAWGDSSERVAPLLDWLGVARRHYEPARDRELEGLVLLDLPDHDSAALAHRVEVDRLVELVDLLVWVLDPQKYADAVVHDRYLRPFAEHAGVLLVVLNQADRLDDADRVHVTDDLRRLLDSEGLERVPVLVTSARFGLGVAELRAKLAQRGAERRAASERLTSDVRVVAAALASHCGDDLETELPKAKRDALVDALADAAGVPLVARAVETSVRSRGSTATGWPLLRWIGGLRADPLRRLHLGGANPGRGRTSLTPPTRTQQAALAGALRSVRDAVAGDVPEIWRDDMRRTLSRSAPELADRLDLAVAASDLDAERSPSWWRVVATLQWLLLLVAFGGALWLLGLAGLAYLQLDDLLPPPRVEGVPLPTLMLFTGLGAGPILALLCRPFVAATARRRSKRAGRRLREAVIRVAEELVFSQVEEVRASYRRYCAAVARLHPAVRR